MIKENVTESKADNCISLVDADNAMDKDAVEAPETVPKDDPEDEILAEVGDNPDANGNESVTIIDTKTVLDEMFAGPKMV